MQHDNCKISLIELGINSYVEYQFYIDIHYCHDHEKPFAADFLRYMQETPEECKHNFVSFKRVSHYIKFLPPEYKPFSMTLLHCFKCSFPMGIEFIVYKGGVENYPKVKDMHKLKLEDIPEAELSGMMTMGIK